MLQAFERFFDSPPGVVDITEGCCGVGLVVHEGGHDNERTTVGGYDTDEAHLGDDALTFVVSSIPPARGGQRHDGLG